MTKRILASDDPEQNSPMKANDASDPRDEQPGPASHNDVRLIVGIGASAGGLAAFKTFFTHMPADTGMAFVLVQHLAPQHKSMLVELLQPQTTMPIVEAKDGIAVAENCIYVIPPDATLTIKEGVLRVVKPAPARAAPPADRHLLLLSCRRPGRAGGRHRPIRRRQRRQLGRANHQGAWRPDAGPGRIRSRRPCSGMPHSAAATGLVDHVVPIEAMPGKLIDYQRHLNEVAGRKDGEGTREDAKEHLGQIAALLRSANGHDFRGYKEKTLIRRVQRRMQVLQIESVACLHRASQGRAGRTRPAFPRAPDRRHPVLPRPEAFDALAAVIDKIIADKGADDQVRIWVPGCCDR